MIDYSLTLQNITKIYGRRLIFKDIDYLFKNSSIYGLAGANGSGKSTLAKIITGLISPTEGKVIHTSTEQQIIPEKLHDYMGFVSPYLVLYDEFTALENLMHFSNIRGINFDKERVNNLLSRFNIYDRRNDYLQTYSSGMKQRMKFIFALLHNPKLLLLDEPTSNLDNAGKDIVYKVIEEEAESNLVIIASNDESDLQLCGEIIEIEKYKNKDPL